MSTSAHLAGSLDHPDMAGYLPPARSADGALLPELSQIVNRALDLRRNSGVADGALQTYQDNIIGPNGLRLVSTPDYRLLGRDKAWAREWSRMVESQWRTFAESMDCDAAGELDFAGQTVQVFRSAFDAGAGLALPLWAADSPTWKTRFLVIDPARLSNPPGRMDGPDLRGGVHVDRYGRALGYWIQKSHPGDAMLGRVEDAGQWEYVPARTPWGRRRVLHVHDRERVGASRGKPSLTAVLRQFKVLNTLTDAELKAAVVNAKVAMVTHSSLSQEAVTELLSSSEDARVEYAEALQERGLSQITMEDGQIIPLSLGESLAGFTPGRPTDSFDPFVTTIFRLIATGLHIPYELLMKDFSRTNYSSARAALIEAWRFFLGRRRWLATYWARPVFELWMEEAVNASRIEAPDFYAMRAAYCRCRWMGAGRGWVDPVKEVDAARIRVEHGFSTMESECAEQGQDWEETLEQTFVERARKLEAWAKEREYAASLGLPLEMIPAPFANAPAVGAHVYPSDTETPAADGAAGAKGGQAPGRKTRTGEAAGASVPAA